MIFIWLISCGGSGSRTGHSINYLTRQIATTSYGEPQWPSIQCRRTLLVSFRKIPFTIKSHRSISAISPAMLQTPFINRTHPIAANFGGIGALTGHEMMHSLDERGSHYAVNGSRLNWWDRSTRREFSKRAECIEEQYSGYEIKSADEIYKVNLRISGSQTLVENLADIGGLKLAYAACSQTTTNSMSGEDGQIFFISYALANCGLLNEASLSEMATGVHTPSHLRVNGALRNQPEFAATFKCPIGSEMNPEYEKRCLVW